MRLNLAVLLLAAAAALLLAESQPAGQGQPIEVHATNAAVEITGYDGDHLQKVENAGGSLEYLAPRNRSIEVSTANGAIRVSGITGTLKLTTSNGAITVQDAGEAEIHAHTSNGAIKLEVSDRLNANLYAHTSNGQIHSDVEVETHRIGADFLEGKIGSGGPEIDLQTSNGAIHVVKGSRQEHVSSTFKPGEVK